MAKPTTEQEITRIHSRLGELDAERASLVTRLAGHLRPAPPALSAGDREVTSASGTVEKIALFRRLFAGRAEVFPVRWENNKTGRSGYAPACANEWVKGVCRKPQVKCGSARTRHSFRCPTT
jgi:hypothetical protein